MTGFKEVERWLFRRVMANDFNSATLRALATAGLFPEGIWKRLPDEKTFRVPLPDGATFTYSAIAKDSIGRFLFWRVLKYYEPQTVRVFCKLAKESGLVVDVGANTGLYTLLACAANRDSKVIAFEPVPRIYSLLVANIEANSWNNRCKLLNMAVSNVEGETKLHVPFSDVPKTASLHSRGFRGCAGHLIDVFQTTIDAIIPENQRVDLVKIDVEGFEDYVLEGMRRVLADSAPTLIVECNVDGPFPKVEAILSQFGYDFFHVRREGPVAVGKIVPDESGRYRNFLCAPHDRRRRFNSCNVRSAHYRRNEPMACGVGSVRGLEEHEAGTLNTATQAVPRSEAVQSKSR
jgi:FkbM family methyltransferase